MKINMADIAMCNGDNCSLKENCYRFKATINPYYQSYFTEIPFDHKSKTCDQFWEMSPDSSAG